MPSIEFCQKNWLALFSGRNIFIIKIIFLHFISPSSSSSLLHAFACVRLKQTIKNRKGATRKGYLFQTSGTWKRRKFASWSQDRISSLSLVEVYEWAGKSAIAVVKGPKTEDVFYIWLWKRQVSVLVVYSRLKDDAFIITVLKRNRQGSKLLCERGIICQ